MSRLAILYGIMFASLLVLPSTSGPARFRPFDDPWVSVQREAPRATRPIEEFQAELDAESEWVHSGNPSSIPLLIRYLHSHEEIVQLAALAEFAGMGPRARRAAPAVRAALNDPKSSIRVGAAATLIHMDSDSQAAIGTLQNELKAADAAAREEAARTIGQLIAPDDYGICCWGSDPPPRVIRPWVGERTLSALAAALRDREPKVRAAAANALRRFSRRAPVRKN